MKRKTWLTIGIGAVVVALLIFLVAPGFVSKPVQPHSLCRNCLYQIEMAKQMFAEEHGFMTNDTIVTDVVLTPAQLSTNYIKHGFAGLHCPEGGTYSINKLSEDPTCSFATQNEKHSLEWIRRK
jgi:hypothetical protein